MMLIITSIWEVWKIRKLGLLLLFSALLCGTLSAQLNDPYGFNNLKPIFSVSEDSIPKLSSQNDKQNNELEFLLATGFNVYKAFFSSQDTPSCVFHPSCSEYAVQTFQKKGLLLGTLRIFDRLSRCHSLFNSNEYYFNPEKQRFYDPVD
jgi:putative membrane protein insertion efficiency factor